MHNSEPPGSEVGSIAQFYEENRDNVRRRIRRVLRNTPDRDIDDLVQEVFVVVVTRWQQVSASPNPTGYAIRIADNLVLEHFKHTATQLKRFGRMGNVDDEESAAKVAGSRSPVIESQPEPAVDEPPDRLQALLCPLVNRPRQAEAVEMHYGYGLTIKEIALFLKANERTVRNNAALGIATLRDHYGQGSASSA